MSAAILQEISEKLQQGKTKDIKVWCRRHWKRAFPPRRF